MLVGECLVNRQVICPPAEMSRLRRSLPGTGRPGYSGHMDLRQQVSFGHRQQRKLDRGCETAGISDMLSLNYLILKCFRKAIDEISSIGFQAEVVPEIDDGTLITIRQRLNERLGLTVPGA